MYLSDYSAIYLRFQSIPLDSLCSKATVHIVFGQDCSIHRFKFGLLNEGFGCKSSILRSFNDYGGPQVQHTNIFQNTQIYFKTHKYISKYTNIFQNTHIYFKIHKYISKYTNIFQNTQIYFKTHKYISKYTSLFLSLKNTEINVNTPK